MVMHNLIYFQTTPKDTMGKFHNRFFLSCAIFWTKVSLLKDNFNTNLYMANMQFFNTYWLLCSCSCTYFWVAYWSIQRLTKSFFISQLGNKRRENCCIKDLALPTMKESRLGMLKVLLKHISDFLNKCEPFLWSFFQVRFCCIF